MLCDEGKLTAKNPRPCKYYINRAFFSESTGYVVEKFCNDEDIYGLADDMDDMSMISLKDKSVSFCSSYKPKIERKAKMPLAIFKKKKANQKKG